MAIGNVLRNLGSVLNPQVAQELGAEDRQNQAMAQNVGMMQLKQQMEQQSPEYQARIQALKNEQLFRQEVAGAGGDMTKIAGAAVKYGKPELAVNLYNQQEARTARLQASAEAMEARKLQMEQNHQLALQRIQDGQQRQAEVVRHNQAMEALNSQNAALNAEIRRQGLVMQGIGVQLQRDKIEQAGGTRLQKQIEGLSKRGDDLAPLYSGIAEVNAVLTPYVEKGQNVPGLGYGSNASFMGLDVAGPFIGEDGKKVRSAIKNVANKILKAESGAAVTLPEEVRQNLALMSTGQFSEEDFLNAWPRVVAAMQSNLDNIAAGYDPDAVKTYRQRGGSLPFGEKLRAVERPKKGANLPKPPDGFTVD